MNSAAPSMLWNAKCTHLFTEGRETAKQSFWQAYIMVERIHYESSGFFVCIFNKIFSNCYPAHSMGRTNFRLAVVMYAMKRTTLKAIVDCVFIACHEVQSMAMFW